MHILIISHERIGDRMAGPAIRCWELARVLNRQFTVTLAAPESSTISSDEIDLLPFAHDDATSLADLEQTACKQADVIISNGYLVTEFGFLQKSPVPWVADIYIPTPVEMLASRASVNLTDQVTNYEWIWHATKKVVQQADFFICASERQRDFWLGVLAAHGCLRPELYADDADLRNLIDVVPFGCPAFPPRPEPVLKGVWPGIAPDDRIILWNGGVWNWFDPLTLLRAMPRVLERHPKAKLVFLGVNHPDSARVPEMARAREARSLSRSLGLEDCSVFWGEWVPYADRGAYLLEADVGVSLNQPGVETRLSFRTRLLDAIWAGLPMVLSRGDVLTQEFERHDLGYIVDCGSIEGVAKAINALLGEADAHSARQAAFSQLHQRFTWESVADPLVQFCRNPHKDPYREEIAHLLESDRNQKTAALEKRIAELEKTVHGYESGRLMRALSALHKLRQRLRKPVNKKTFNG
jgi:glycosyltransferase involved in cell wall biosynthesis